MSRDRWSKAYISLGKYTPFSHPLILGLVIYSKLCLEGHDRCAYTIILNFHHSISEVMTTVKGFLVGWAVLVTEPWSIKPAGTQHFRSRLKCVGESFGVCWWATSLLQVSTSAFLPAAELIASLQHARLRWTIQCTYTSSKKYMQVSV